MKILIVYYSKTGHTQTIANELAQSLSADLEQLTEIQSQEGILGIINISKDALLQNSIPINDLKHQITNYDLVIIGTPIWMWNMSNPIRSFLEKQKTNFKKVAFFATMGSSGDKRAFINMEKIIGIAPIATVSFTDAKIKSGEFKNELKAFAESVAKGL